MVVCVAAVEVPSLSPPLVAGFPAATRSGAVSLRPVGSHKGRLRPRSTAECMNKKAFGGLPLKWAGVLAVTGILLAGCASSSTEGDVQAPGPAADTNAGATISGTGGQLIQIQSDNVAAAGYDDATRTMLVEFDDGSLYEYAPVPASVWIDFVAAQPHPWSRVGNPVLVEGRVPYRKVH